MIKKKTNIVIQENIVQLHIANKQWQNKILDGNIVSICSPIPDTWPLGGGFWKYNV